MVRPASRMLRAISFGVFCRLGALDQGDHPVEEALAGSVVMRTTMRSESTRVPPVTPSGRRRTRGSPGRDSPVMALSSTDGDALDHLAVAGDQLAGLAHAHVALVAARWRTSLLDAAVGSCTTLAVVSARVLRRVSAWALPRPSAMASAKLAKSTVNQSQSGDEAGEPVLRRASPCPGRLKNRKVVTDAADLHHEHDRVVGHAARGSSFRKASTRGPPHDRGVEERGGAAVADLRGPLLGSGAGSGDVTVDGHRFLHLRTAWASCSTIGPRARTGK